MSLDVVTEVATLGECKGQVTEDDDVLLFCFLVAPQHAQEIGDLAQVRQRLGAAVFLDVAEEIQIEEIFKRAAAQRTRFHLGQIDIAQGKNTQALEERPGRLRVENTMETLLALRGTRAGFGEQQKPGVKFSRWSSRCVFRMRAP